MSSGAEGAITQPDWTPPVHLRLRLLSLRMWPLLVGVGLALMPLSVDRGAPVFGLLGYLMAFYGVLSIPRHARAALMRVMNGPFRPAVIIFAANAMLRMMTGG